MRSGFRSLFYLLTVIVFIATSVSCSPAKETPISPITDTETINTQPVVLTVTLDDSASVSALIPQQGGSVSATLANGLVYTLNIPEGALLSDQEVTLTPIRSIDGLPFSGGLIGGVQLEPDGTTLMTPATLTIQIPQGYDKRYLVGFGYHGSGTGLHLTPSSGDGNIITLNILSFSGHGAASGTDQEVKDQASRSTGSAADGYMQQLADILDRSRESERKVSDSEMQEINQLWKDYYDKVVKPALQAAVSDDNKIDSAMGLYRHWSYWLLFLGNGDEMESRITEGFALVIKGLKNAYEKAAKRCVSNQDMHEVSNMFKRLRQLFLYGDSDPNYTMQAKVMDFERCVRFRVNFESIITATPSTEQQIVSHVAGSVILKLVPDYFALNIYRGTGDLKFKAYTSEWVGGSAGMNSVCRFTNLTTKDGKLRMAGRFWWSNLNSPEPKYNFLLGVKPSDLEQGFPNLKCDTGMSSIQTNVNFKQSMWSGSFDKLHSDIKINIPEMDDIEMYYFEDFGLGSGKLFARLAQSKTLTLPEGTMAEDLIIDIFEAPGAEQ